MTQTFAQTTGGRLLAQGRTSDYECARTSNRLQESHTVLRAMGAEYTTVHASTPANEGFDWATRTPRHRCTSACTGSWTPWVTGAILDAVYEAASAAVTARGAYNRRPVGV